MTDRKLDIIAKLLAKAESTTPAEAEALTAKAEELMIRHNIAQLDLETHRSNGKAEVEKIITQRRKYSGTYSEQQVRLAWRVTQSLGLQGHFMDGYRSERTYFIVGFQRDVDAALLLLDSLQIQAAVAMRDWWKAQRDNFYWLAPHEQLRERKTFLNGFAAGAGDRLRKMQRTVTEEYRGTGTDVALVDRERAVKAHYDAANPRVRVVTSRARSGSYNSRAAGVAAGQRANLGGTAVGGGARGIGR